MTVAGAGILASAAVVTTVAIASAGQWGRRAPGPVRFLRSCGNRSGLGQRALLQPPVLEYESSRSTTKTRVEPAGINGEGDCLP